MATTLNPSAAPTGAQSGDEKASALIVVVWGWPNAATISATGSPIADAAAVMPTVEKTMFPAPTIQSDPKFGILRMRHNAMWRECPQRVESRLSRLVRQLA